MTYYHGNYDNVPPGPDPVLTVPTAPVRADCGACEGPCRYGKCGDCGGHSEHNWGCPQVPSGAIYPRTRLTE